jgi:hypothetical protein
VKSSLVLEPGRVTAAVDNAQDRQQPLKLQVSFLTSGSVRVKLSEHTPRWQVSDSLCPLLLTSR